jgi:mono/diheme cytochrome c family protein
MQTKHKALLLGTTTILAAAIAFAGVVWGGVVTVAGTDPHYAPVQWTLQTTMESSVRHHAADVEIPAGVDLRDPALAERAFGHYSVACTPCHGAPGVDAAPWMVLNPPAEPLVETADRWTDQELYWIVKNGIKMTGMPALGPTHGEDDLWAISAMVRQLPAMTPEQYQGMADRANAPASRAMDRASHSGSHSATTSSRSASREGR